MRWTLVAQAGHGTPYLPCTAISGRKAVTFSGNFSPASRRSRSVQSRSVFFVASLRRATSASESRDVRATGESFAAWRISSEYAFPMPEKSVGSVRARFSVWFSLLRRAVNCSRVAPSGSPPPGPGAGGEAAGIERGGRVLSGHEPKPRALLRARLGQEQRPGVEVESQKADPLRDRGAGCLPLQAAGDHQVKDEEEIFFEREYETLPQPGHPKESPALHVLDRRSHGTDDERARQPELSQDLTPHEAVEVLHVNGHVRQLGHPMRE